MLDGVTTYPLSEFAAMIGPECNPYLTISVSYDQGPRTIHFTVADVSNGLPHDRVVATIEYLKYLFNLSHNLIAVKDGPIDFLFQAEDNPANVASFSWETMNSWSEIKLIPDLYYYGQGGYENGLTGDISWESRQRKIIWRGSTTGLLNQRFEDLDRLPRYQICAALSKQDHIADVGLNAVVQFIDDEQENLIRERLVRENILKPFLPMQDMAQYRYILDIDGNANSWNFIAKLRLGCCILRVESEWRQWFWPRLSPWVHYVPIANDLSDVETIVDWCFENEDECAEIARRGLDFGLSMRFSDEMTQAASTIFAA